jgi:hypothetical protein
MWADELPNLRRGRSLFQLSCVANLLVFSFGVFAKVLLPELNRGHQVCLE